MRNRLVYSKSDGHFYVIPVNRLDDWDKWYSRDEPRGMKTPEWAIVVEQSAMGHGINNALAYFSFNDYAMERLDK